VDPVPDPLLLRKKSGSPGNRTRTSGSVARNSDHYISHTFFRTLIFYAGVLLHRITLYFLKYNSTKFTFCLRFACTLTGILFFFFRKFFSINLKHRFWSLHKFYINVRWLERLKKFLSPPFLIGKNVRTWSAQQRCIVFSFSFRNWARGLSFVDCSISFRKPITLETVSIHKLSPLA
jgi:hypothetical protein